LLEAMVFGYSTGRHAYKQIKANTTGPHFQTIISKIPYSSRTELDIGDITHSLRSAMSRTVGVLRSEAKLKETIEIIDFWQSYILDKVFDSVKGWECQNMLTISKLIAQQALLRQESRGVHFRSDFPEPNEILCHHLDITSN
jgi:L-aspartate oxidase